MFGWGKPKRPKVVAFDAIGTMFPLDPLRPSLMALGLPWAGLESWYATAVRDALALTASGDFEPFTTVLEGALDQVLGELRIPGSCRPRFREIIAHHSDLKSPGVPI